MQSQKQCMYPENLQQPNGVTASYHNPGRSLNLNLKIHCYCVVQILPVLHLNSLCVPCPEKMITKFLVFPVSWPPCLCCIATTICECDESFWKKKTPQQIRLSFFYLLDYISSHTLILQNQKEKKNIRVTIPCKWSFVHEKHLKSTWKVKSTWKAPEKWKAHLKSEKHMKSTWKVKSTWKAHLKSEKHTWKVKNTWTCITNYRCIYVAYGLRFYNFLLIRISWRIAFGLMSCWHEVTTLRFVITSCSHVVTLCHRWCHLAHASGPIKGLRLHHRGFTPSSSPDEWGGTCARIDWRAGTSALLEPTSFKLN